MFFEIFLLASLIYKSLPGTASVELCHYQHTMATITAELGEVEQPPMALQPPTTNHAGGKKPKNQLVWNQVTIRYCWLYIEHCNEISLQFVKFQLPV